MLFLYRVYTWLVRRIMVLIPYNPMLVGHLGLITSHPNIIDLLIKAVMNRLKHVVDSEALPKVYCVFFIMYMYMYINEYIQIYRYNVIQCKTHTSFIFIFFFDCTHVTHSHTPRERERERDPRTSAPAVYKNIQRVFPYLNAGVVVISHFCFNNNCFENKEGQ